MDNIQNWLTRLRQHPHPLWLESSIVLFGVIAVVLFYGATTSNFDGLAYGTRYMTLILRCLNDLLPIPFIMTGWECLVAGKSFDKPFAYKEGMEYGREPECIRSLGTDPSVSQEMPMVSNEA
jgi:hypothetical protein